MYLAGFENWHNFPSHVPEMMKTLACVLLLIMAAYLNDVQTIN